MSNIHTFKSSISKEEIAQLPQKKFIGEVFYIDSYKGLEQFVPGLLEETLLGFDTETRPSFKKGVSYDVALLQLSTATKAYLFRLNKIGLPQVLLQLLSNPGITKTGIAIRDDILGLQKLSPFKPEGFIELQDYVKNFNIEDNSLKKLTANILGFNVSKRQQTSNWEQDMLTVPQIEYAATDAWVCYAIYEKLQTVKKINGNKH